MLLDRTKRTFFNYNKHIPPLISFVHSFYGTFSPKLLWLSCNTSMLHRKHVLCESLFTTSNARTLYFNVIILEWILISSETVLVDEQENMFFNLVDTHTLILRWKTYSIVVSCDAKYEIYFYDDINPCIQINGICSYLNTSINCHTKYLKRKKEFLNSYIT